jgi:hypothetical protein
MWLGQTQLPIYVALIDGQTNQTLLVDEEWKNFHISHEINADDKLGLVKSTLVWNKRLQEIKVGEKEHIPCKES